MPTRLSGAQAAALNPVRVSTATYGARLSGERAIGSLKLGYAGSYAQQSDYGSNPLRFDLDYYLAEIQGTVGRYGLRLGPLRIGTRPSYGCSSSTCGDEPRSAS
jgi:hypothetical protein